MPGAQLGFCCLNWPWPGTICQHGPVNTASQDLPHHLDVLRQKLHHATDYELALAYFLEEFAGDAKFMLQCEPDEAPHLLAVLGHVAAKALGKPATLDRFRAFGLPGTGFYHGNAAARAGCSCSSTLKAWTPGSWR